MRTVLKSNTETIETFNRQNQSHGKCGNLFFEGDTLYSYGYHYPLAMFVKADTILINDEGYSPTTLKHIYKTRRITENRKQLRTSKLCLSLVAAEMEWLDHKLSKARKPQIYTKQIWDLYNDFYKGVAEMGGFYIKTKGYFTGTRFELVKWEDRTNEQKNTLNRIEQINANILKYNI